MSLKIHKANQRGFVSHGWLESYFSFSFAEYHDASRMGFGTLRVINDDMVQAGKGFSMHPHRDMEIVSIVTKGELLHKDSQGNESVTKAGEIQYMSAASGVYHSEFASLKEDVHLLQIWIRPNVYGGTPKYEQKNFKDKIAPNKWITLVSRDGRDDSIKIKQDASISIIQLENQREILLQHTTPNHGRLLFVISGSVKIGEYILNAKDEIQITDNEAYELKALEKSEILFFDVVDCI